MSVRSPVVRIFVMSIGLSLVVLSVLVTMNFARRSSTTSGASWTLCGEDYAVCVAPVGVLRGPWWFQDVDVRIMLGSPVNATAYLVKVPKLSDVGLVLYYAEYKLGLEPLLESLRAYSVQEIRLTQNITLHVPPDDGFLIVVIVCRAAGEAEHAYAYRVEVEHRVHATWWAPALMAAVGVALIALPSIVEMVLGRDELAG